MRGNAMIPSMTNLGRAHRVAAGVVVVALLTAACTSGARMRASTRPTQPGTPAAKGFAKFPDIPIPRGASMDLNRTLILGTQHEWIGRLAIKAGYSAGPLYDFYNREMGRFGWREVSSVRAGTSILTFTRGERVATVQISERTIAGSLVDVTVSPYGTVSAKQPATSVARQPARNSRSRQTGNSTRSRQPGNTKWLPRRTTR